MKELHCSTCNKIQPPGQAHGAWVIPEPSPAGPHAAPPWLSMASSRAALTLPPSPNETFQLLPASGPLHLAVPSTFHIPEPLWPSVLSLNVCPPERRLSHSPVLFYHDTRIFSSMGTCHVLELLDLLKLICFPNRTDRLWGFRKLLVLLISESLPLSQGLTQNRVAMRVCWMKD